MRPGILIQHSTELAREGEFVRCDVVGFIGVITQNRWPNGVSRGDFVELPLQRLSELLDHPARELFDPITRRAVEQFFRNGGNSCRIFGLCIGEPEEMIADDPDLSVFSGLIDRLRGEEDVGILAMPALAYLPIEVHANSVHVPVESTWRMLLEHCREMNNRFLIIDVSRGLHEHHLQMWVRNFRASQPEVMCFGAIYYPWLLNGDDLFPPSGCVAGVYAALEVENAPFGVRWPPANRTLTGVTHPELELAWSELDGMTDAHINPILTQPGRGVVIWGARTLSAESRWVHINARRIVSMISEQLRRDSEWVVFENQRPELWEIVARTVRGRLDQMWDTGLLTGNQAGSEYEVQCDAETNPLEVREAGQIHVRVTIRPVTTAEFIVVDLRLGQ